jgi:GTPase
MRFGTVAIVGRSNVGKSTLLNALLGEKLAIVSSLPQTTREPLLGVASTPAAQIGFLDTPGLHRPKSELGRRMNLSALEAARAADVLLMMTDVTEVLRGKGLVPEEDRAILAQLPEGATCLLAINKVDLLPDKSRLLPLMDAFNQLRPLAGIVPVSIRNAEDVKRVLDEIVALLPEGSPGYPEDTLTDKPTAFFVREYIREQVLLQAGREVPHAVAVTIDQIDETPQAMTIKATLHVEKVGQRKILIGHGGTKIREIGTRARERIQELVGRKVHLSTFVRVTPRWKNATRQLAEFGYQAERGGAEFVLPDAAEASGRSKRR